MFRKIVLNEFGQKRIFQFMGVRGSFCIAQTLQTSHKHFFCLDRCYTLFIYPYLQFEQSLDISFFYPMQHPYVYTVLVFEAMATFVGQVSVLSLIALFGAATTAMVSTPTHNT